MREHFRTAARLFVLLVFFCAGAASLQAERVTSLSLDGVLELESGKKVILAGVELPVESFSLLTVLLSGKNVEVEAAVEGPVNGPVPVYMYVQTSQVDLPNPADGKPEEEKVMINELLIKLGAAKVSGVPGGKHFDVFKKAEDKARESGQGIWSYEEALLRESSPVGLEPEIAAEPAAGKNDP